MLKIYKFLKLRRSLPHVTTLRFASKDCVKHCPPVYECKQPERDKNEELMAILRERAKPRVFKEVHLRDVRIYRNIFFFVCIPVVICAYINAFYMNDEMRKRPKFIPFSYLRIRRKPFPWDEKRTLFHNPRYNALPDGYEIEVPEEEEYDPFEPHKK